MIESLRFMFIAWRAYRRAKDTDRVAYSAITWRGVPNCCIFVGVGRNAWKVSQRAIAEFEAVEKVK